MAYQAVCPGDVCHNRDKPYWCDIKGKMVCCNTQATKWWWVDHD